MNCYNDVVKEHIDFFVGQVNDHLKQFFFFLHNRVLLTVKQCLSSKEYHKIHSSVTVFFTIVKRG